MSRACYLDANVLVFFVNSSSLFHQEAVELLEYAVEQRFVLNISSLVIDEAVHAMKRTLASSPRIGKNRADGALKEALEMILSLPDLTIVQPPTSVAKNAKVIGLMKMYSLRARDAFHLLTMQEHHISYYATFDSDFDAVFDQGTLKKVIRD